MNIQIRFVLKFEKYIRNVVRMVHITLRRNFASKVSLGAVFLETFSVTVKV